MNAGSTSSSSPSSLSVQIGIGLAAVLALWGVLESFSYEKAYQAQYRDPYQIGSQGVRFEEFNRAVPRDAILGYLTDLQAGSVAADAAFLGAQYAVAPRLLEKGSAGKRDWVLGNFSKPEDAAAAGREFGLRVERDFGNGVILYRRAGEGR